MTDPSRAPCHPLAPLPPPLHALERSEQRASAAAPGAAAGGVAGFLGQHGPAMAACVGGALLAARAVKALSPKVRRNDRAYGERELGKGRGAGMPGARGCAIMMQVTLQDGLELQCFTRCLALSSRVAQQPVCQGVANICLGCACQQAEAKAAPAPTAAEPAPAAANAPSAVAQVRALLQVRTSGQSGAHT